MTWTPESIPERVAALTTALEGIELVECLPDGRIAARLAPENFGALVVAGGDVESNGFADGMTHHLVVHDVGPVRLYCDFTAPTKGAE